MLEIAIVNNTKLRANQQYPIIAGVDDGKVPRLVKTDEDGRLIIGGAAALPEWNTFELEYWDAGKTNIKFVIYKAYDTSEPPELVEVARVALTYANGGTVANDALTGGTITIA